MSSSSLRERHNVQSWGQGRETLVFGHGLGTNQDTWREVAQRLSAERQVVLLDWVGSGHSDIHAFDSVRHSSLRGHAEDLCALLRELRLGPTTFVGHSAGAMIGVLAGIAEPKLFTREVLLMTSPRYLDDPPDYFGGFTEADVAAVLALMRENFVGWTTTFAALAAKDADVERELEATFRSNDPGRLHEFAEAVLRCDFRDELPMLQLPTLLVASSNDDMVPVSVSEFVHRQIRGSSYQCVDIAGHCPQLTRPELVAAMIRSFLDGSGVCA